MSNRITAFNNRMQATKKRARIPQDSNSNALGARSPVIASTNELRVNNVLHLSVTMTRRSVADLKDSLAVANKLSKSFGLSRLRFRCLTWLYRPFFTSAKVISKPKKRSEKNAMQLTSHLRK